MAYAKYVYSRINWKNKSNSLATPLGETNLNQMDSAIYHIAENLDIVHEDFSTGKFDKADAGKVIVGMPTWNSNTGVLSFQFYDGTTFQVDFNIEKIPVSFSMDSAGVITMTTADGTQWTANIGDVVPDYAYDDSETIAFTKGYDWDTSQYSQIDAYGYGPPDHWAAPENRDRVYLDRSSGIAYACAYDGKKYFLATAQLQRTGKNERICGEVRKGSITSEHLRPDYLADVTAKAGDAAASAKSASDSADGAAFDAKLAQSYAVGGSGVRQGEDGDNAKKYKELCQDIFDNLQQSGSVTGVKGETESEFRHGNVSLSPEDIGAAPFDVIANGNFNAMTTPGIYTMRSTAAASANGPTTGGYHSLIVLRSDAGAYVQQIAVREGTTDVYVRYGSDATWSAWVRLLKAGDLDELKKSVSDGKSAVASAITDMGVSTSSDAAFSALSDNIKNISKDATAHTWDIIEGKTAYSNGQKITGTLKEYSSVGFKFVGATCKFPPGVVYMVVGHSIDHVSYSQLNLHLTINSYDFGSVGEYNEWNCPYIRVTGTGGINVLRSGWALDVTNYCKMYVTLYGKSDYVGGGMEFRGCVGVCSKGASSSTGGEGRDYAMSYAAYFFNSVSSQWLETLEVDLSWISQEVQFHMSTVHAGEVWVNSVTFVPN